MSMAGSRISRSGSAGLCSRAISSCAALTPTSYQGRLTVVSGTDKMAESGRFPTPVTETAAGQASHFQRGAAPGGENVAARENRRELRARADQLAADALAAADSEAIRVHDKLLRDGKADGSRGSRKQPA
jgi:hypothetical protein